MKSIDFYFDFISPFAYLAAKRLDSLTTRGCTVNLKPILFAGLLNYYGQKGPAEIAPKRLHTYRQVLWLAKQAGVPMRMPTGHPFNPLPLLRLQLASGNTLDAMQRIFDFVWVQGNIPTDAAAFEALALSLGIDNREALDAPAVKATLRSNSDQAVAAQVFGVPSFVVEGNCFWGADHLEMLHAYLNGDAFFAQNDVLALGSLPTAASRL
jgi:2-hydroxychromene-2-carboxylate isomerase